MSIVHPVLQKVERYTETGETKFSVQSHFLKAEEILIDVLGEITTNKLLAAIVESGRTITSRIIESGPEEFC
jgi:hypothetical protein